jgi:hypothetical protein
MLPSVAFVPAAAASTSPAAAASTSPSVTYLALSLNTSSRATFIATNQRVVPGLRIFRAVNGFDKSEVIRSLAYSRLKYHILTYCAFTRFGTYGSLANYLTKFFALMYQVQQRLPFMAMIEDDMALQPGFAAFVEAAARRHLADTSRCRRRRHAAPRCDRTDLIVLGAWGEGYVSSLESARRVVHSIREQGVPQNVDIMLNEGHAGPVARVSGTPWAHRVGPNLGDCLKTPHVQYGEVPQALLGTPPRCAGRASCLEWLRRQRRRYCRPPRQRAAVGMAMNRSA